MNTHIAIAESPKKNKFKIHFSPLFFIAFFAYALIAITIIVYLRQDAVFISRFSLVLPGTGSTSKVTMEEIGQVSQSSTSAFSSHSYNPRSNYKQILQSSAVKEIAARSLGIATQDIGKIKIELIEQTSIIGISSQSKHPDQATLQAWAIYEAFQQELDRLRIDEAERYEGSIERMLEVHRERLNKTRKAIVEFQQRSLLVSQSQVDTVVTMLAKIKNDLTFSLSERESHKRFIHQLSIDLGVSPALAAHALTLQSDAEFKGYLVELDQTATQMSRFVSQWGDNHPKVVAEKERYQIVLKNLKKRSSKVVGINSSEILHGMNLSASERLSTLFADLLDHAAKLQGLEAKISELRLAEIRVDDKLRVYSREAAELERLEREHQRAEVVYSSAAARLEAGKTDVFGSYPVVQMLSTPNSPLSNDQTKKLIALAAGIFGYFIVTLVLLLLWKREKFITLLLKRR